MSLEEKPIGLFPGFITNMKRDTFLPSISTLLIFGMTVFLSCAHQNRVDEGLGGDEAQAEQAAITEEGSTSADGTASSNELSDLSQTPDAAAAGLEGTTGLEGTADAQAPTADAAATTSAENQDLAVLGTDDKSLEALAPTDAQPVGDATAGALDTTAGEATPPAGGTELDPLTTLGTESTAGAVAATTDNNQAGTPPPTDPTTTIAKNDPSIIPMEPVISPVGGAKTSFGGEKTSHFSGTSHVPKIPSNAVTRKGTKLNRFYFVRQGDTAGSVSNLIYGSEDHAAKLTQWNGKGWKAGKLLYYQSPVDATERKMRSFYQEKNVQPEEYTIERGDWLSKVAQKKLGSSGSWKEIAVVNGMATPDALEVGHKIAIYPKDLSGYSGNRVAEEPKEEPKAEQPPQVVHNNQPQQPQQVPQQAQPVDPNQDMMNQVPPQQPQAEQPKPVVQKNPPLDISKIIDQNTIGAIAIGGILFLSALYLMRRKKTAKPLDEFADDNFAPPTKLKRK